nr:PREDICTED: cleft lip and palate transmembrane protein 1-like protein isoform X1 [Bemisia tabaci]
MLIMYIPSLSLILSLCFTAYIGHSMWTMAKLFIAPECQNRMNCIHSFLNSHSKLQMVIFSSVSGYREDDLKFVHYFKDFNFQKPFEHDLDVEIPYKTRRNGTLFFHVHIFPNALIGDEVRWESVQRSPNRTSTLIEMTQYQIPETSKYKLLQENSNVAPERPVTHLKTEVGINMLTNVQYLPLNGIPGEIAALLRFSRNREFLPIVRHDFLNDRLQSLQEIKKGVSSMQVKLKYSPISFGMLRLMLHVEASMSSVQTLGFSVKEIDQVKGIFADTNIYLLLGTIFVSGFHLLFDFLAFKNDVSFWHSRKSLAGISAHTVLWHAFSHIIILLYLIEEKSSLLILIPSFIGALIEVWKVHKVIPIDWKHLKFKKAFVSSEEQRTKEFDRESMKYLCYLYPLIIGAAVYSLVNEVHRSWYSWIIRSTVNGVYAFGFIFMLPQLFVNYRLKSVAHLPWRTFMYKAFSTFIDDVFAFIITMPTAHRLACFRDDVVFLIYLYQRWLYPVDKSRIDEDTSIVSEVPTIDAKKSD